VAEATGKQIILDQRLDQQRVFVSIKDVAPFDLLQKCVRAAGLQLRQVGDLTMVAQPVSEPSRSLSQYQMVADRKRRLREALNPISRKQALADGRVPFSDEYFRMWKRVPFASLNDAQRNYVQVELFEQFRYKPPSGHGAESQARPHTTSAADVPRLSDIVGLELEFSEAYTLELGCYIKFELPSDFLAKYPGAYLAPEYERALRCCNSVVVWYSAGNSRDNDQ